MNKDKYVFAQMVEFLDNYKFLRIVKKYDGNKYVKHFTCWNQLLQMVEFLDNYKFLRIVKKYDGNKYVKHFTCWNQLLTLMFGQLCNRESLRDLIVALNAEPGLPYL